MAQDQPKLESLIVTGTYLPREELASAMHTMDRVQIEALQKTTVTGILKTLPGLLVEEQGGPGGLAAVSIHGAEANFTLVLLDGVAVNDPTNSRGGGYDFGNLDTADIERIEVVYGAQSAIYGSDALAGVIHIITRDFRAASSMDIHAAIGEGGASSFSARVRGALNAAQYDVSISSRDAGDIVPASYRENEAAKLGLQWGNDKHRITADFRYLSGYKSTYPEQSGGVSYAVDRSLDESRYKEGGASISWQSSPSNILTSSLNISHFEHQESIESPGIYPYGEVPPNGADTEFSRSLARWTNSFVLGSEATLDLGAEIRHESGNSSGFLDFFGTVLPTDFELSRTTRSVHLGLHVSPLDSLLVTAAVRYDSPDDYQHENSVSTGIRYRLHESLSMSLNWGESYKLPSFFALGHPLVGNSELAPELSENLNFSLRLNPTDALQFTAMWFDNRFENLIDFDEATFTNVNRQKISTSGHSLQFAWQPADSFSFSGNYTETRYDLHGEATVLTARPEHRGAIVAIWRVFDNFSLSADYQYTGKQWSTSRHTGMEVTDRLDSHHLVNFGLSWELTATTTCRVALDNVTDSKYETAVGFPAPARTFRLGVSVSL